MPADMIFVGGLAVFAVGAAVLWYRLRHRHVKQSVESEADQVEVDLSDRLAADSVRAERGERRAAHWRAM